MTTLRMTPTTYTGMTVRLSEDLLDSFTRKMLLPAGSVVTVVKTSMATQTHSVEVPGRSFPVSVKISKTTPTAIEEYTR